MAKQRYSYLGLLIVLMMAVVVVWLLEEFFKATPPKSELTQAEIEVHLRCEQQHGLLAVSRGPYGTWMECFQGRKKIWSVKL